MEGVDKVIADRGTLSGRKAARRHDRSLMLQHYGAVL
jgi:hypothetical protein